MRLRAWLGGLWTENVLRIRGRLVITLYNGMIDLVRHLFLHAGEMAYTRRYVAI